jgi:Holliday junction resolvase RusA-like endonuclease
MSKPPLTFKLRLPPYRTPRNSWRHDLHAVIKSELDRRKIQYNKTEKLELNVVLYLKTTALHFHDVDNRLKDIMDALQGRAGGRKTMKPIIPNDSQVFKVTIEKMLPPPQSHGLGHLIVKKYLH